METFKINLLKLKITYFGVKLVMENKTQTLDQTLEKTDFGHFLHTHKTLVIIFFVLIVVGTAGFSIYRNQSEENREQALTEIYKFTTTKFAEFQTKKISKDEILASYNALNPKVLKNPGIFSLATDLALELKNQGANDEAIKILESALNNYSNSNYAYYLMASNLAVLYEDTNQLDKAISTLEGMTKSKVKIMESKTYFDLGRIYKLKGDINNASVNFNYVMSNFASDEYAKLARIYMSEMELVK